LPTCPRGREAYALELQLQIGGIVSLGDTTLSPPWNTTTRSLCDLKLPEPSASYFPCGRQISNWLRLATGDEVARTCSDAAAGHRNSWFVPSRNRLSPKAGSPLLAPPSCEAAYIRFWYAVDAAYRSFRLRIQPLRPAAYLDLAVLLPLDGHCRISEHRPFSAARPPKLVSEPTQPRHPHFLGALFLLTAWRGS